MYLSTRNKADSFTAHRVLRSDAAPDGGLFMPMQIPVMDDIALAGFEQMNFGESIASILNLFFGTQISGWDVDFAAGRQAVELVSCGYKILLSESWHNPSGTHDYFANRLYCLVTGETHPAVVTNHWFHTAVNIALLFGIYSKYCRQEIYTFDVAIESGNLQLLLAARYAQRMGLPIRKIILASNEGDGLWEFLSYGEYQTYRKAHPRDIEALLWLEFGYTEVQRYLRCTRDRLGYRLNAADLERFQRDIFPAVIGEYRVNNAVDSVLRGTNYGMDTDTARAFCALQDYRAKTGENKNTILFAHNAPKK